MGKVCPDEITADQLDKMVNVSYDAFYFVGQLQSAVVIVCAAILFGCYRKLSKPSFVWVMWGLFILAEVAHFAETIFDKEISKAREAGDTEMYDRMICLYYECFTVYATALMGGHWVFAIKYAEVVLNLPLLVFPEDVGDIQAKLKKISCMVWTLNGFFAASIFTFSFFMQLSIFGVWVGEISNTLLTVLENVLVFAPTVLLLVAVIKVRCMVSKLRNKAILQKERIILLHTVLFGLYLLLNIMGDIAYKIESSTEDILTECKATVTDIGSGMSSEIIDICITVLITYMSIRFCKPLDGQWQQFLLGYREKSLQAYLRERCGGTEVEKARRFHDAAVMDANRQIMIISALLDNTQSMSEQDYTVGSQSESLVDFLNTDEREILASSTISVTSSILFHQVRMEAAARVSPSTVLPMDLSRSTINEEDEDQNQSKDY